MALRPVPGYGGVPSSIGSYVMSKARPVVSLPKPAAPPSSGALAGLTTRIPQMPGFTAPAAPVSSVAPAAPTITPSLDTNPSAQRLFDPANFQANLDDIYADPMYQSALNAYTANTQAARQNLGGQINALVTQSGYNLAP